MSLPDKLRNAGEWRVADQTRVQINGFTFDISRIKDQVFKYELKFTANSTSGEVKDLSQGNRNDVSTELRRNLHWELYMKLLAQQGPFFHVTDPKKDLFSFVYDRGINFYSLRDLGLTINETRQFTLDGRDDLSDEGRSYLRRMRDPIVAHLTYTKDGVLNLRNPVVNEENNRSVAQFLDILSNQEVYRLGTYYQFSSKMFRKESNIQLQGDPRILKDGMQKNIRFVGDDIANAKTILQVDAKKAAFFPTMLLSDFIAEFLGSLLQRPPQNAREVYQGNNLSKIREQVKNLMVITTHLQPNRSFQIRGLTNEACNVKTFNRQSQDIIVSVYFENQYRSRLQYPELPCVIERRTNATESYYPCEVLKIMPGQRVPLQKQTPRLTEQMIRNCQAQAYDLSRNIEQQKQGAVLQSSNTFFQQFGIRVLEQLVTNASILHPPAITYGDQEIIRVEPDRNGVFPDRGWRLDRNDGKRFIRPCTNLAPGNNWAAVIVCGGVTGDDCMNFLQKFVRNAVYRGIQLQVPKELQNIWSLTEDTFTEMFAFFKSKKIYFIMFFSKDKIDFPSHHGFKVMEERHGIVTQHIVQSTMAKGLGTRGDQMVLDNLLMKFNLKNGGINHGLVTSAAFSQLNGSNDIMSKKWFSASRMFFGFDLSHASPQSVFERQNPGEVLDFPSIVGMAYTVSQKVLDMRGTFWAQETRVTTIKPDYMVDHLVRAIDSFRSSSRGTFPAQLIIFRAGCSEGEFRTVADDEVSAFKKAFSEIKKTEPKFKDPSITVIVCQRGSNYRIVPERINKNDRAPLQNCRPGTIVNSDVMNPRLTEFVLIGHTTIQGTGQPVRCTVVYDDATPRISLQELEFMAYSLCYAHGIVTLPVSVPGVLYAAQDLSKRGHNNFKMRREFNENFCTIRQGANIEGIHREISLELSPTGINTKFWA